MNPLIETLFEAVQPSLQSKAEAAAAAEAEKTVRIVEERLTKEEFDQLWTDVMRISYTRQLESFTWGLRLGVQLTMEVLKPAEEAIPSVQPNPRR